MKEMNYQTERIEEVLFAGTYLGYDFEIVSYGSHPCCYVKIPKGHPYFGLDYDDINVDCHGGLTFASERGEAWWIGWDYAHFGDYSSFHSSVLLEHMPLSNWKKWTTEELFAEVKKVIEQLPIQK
jgi:hypothetical protein